MADLLTGPLDRLTTIVVGSEERQREGAATTRLQECDLPTTTRLVGGEPLTTGVGGSWEAWEDS